MVQATLVAAIFKPDNYVQGANCAGNNCAKGHYTEGAELIDEGIDVIHKKTEACDCFHGYQISLGGSTGSGIGTLLLIKIRDDYPDRITCTFSVYLSSQVSDVVVEPYNATLSLHQSLENSDEPFAVMYSTILKQKQPKYTDLNWVMSSVISGIAESLRFGGKIDLNLTLPRLFFFAMAEALLFAPNEANKIKLLYKKLLINYGLQIVF